MSPLDINLRTTTLLFVLECVTTGIESKITTIMWVTSGGQDSITANFGIIDLAGFPKDHYYLYQSLWSTKPMVHLLPHWTHPGKEGVVIPVVVYTNCAGAELFLNGESLGKKEMSRERQIVWQVPYVAGTITAVAYDSEGNKVSKSYTTAGEAAAIDLIVDQKEVSANETDRKSVV